MTDELRYLEGKVTALVDNATDIEKKVDEILAFINELKGALSEVSANPMVKMMGVPPMFGDAAPADMPQLPGMPPR